MACIVTLHQAEPGCAGMARQRTRHMNTTRVNRQTQRLLRSPTVSYHRKSNTYPHVHTHTTRSHNVKQPQRRAHTMMHARASESNSARLSLSLTHNTRSMHTQYAHARARRDVSTRLYHGVRSDGFLADATVRLVALAVDAAWRCRVAAGTTGRAVAKAGRAVLLDFSPRFCPELACCFWGMSSPRFLRA